MTSKTLLLLGRETMNSPYKSRLEDLLNMEVVLYRADSSDLKGKLVEVAEDGCMIK